MSSVPTSFSSLDPRLAIRSNKDTRIAVIPNDDVLDHILQACPISSLAALSLVSSHFHALVVPHLLRTVKLDKNPEQITNFLCLIVNDTHRTGTGGSSGLGGHIFELDIVDLAFLTFIPDGELFKPVEKEEYPVSDWAHILTSALALMPNLRSVTIGDMVEEIAEHCPDFASILLSRPWLTSLTLGNVGPIASDQFGRATDLTRNIQAAKLQIVKIGSDHGTFKDTLEIAPNAGMGQLLLRASASLAEVHLRGNIGLRGLLGHAESELSPGRNEIATPIIFPDVRVLLISDRDISLKGLSTAFPALKTLIICFLVVPRDATPPPRTQVSFANLVSIQGLIQNVSPFLDSIADSKRIRRVVIEGSWDTEDELEVGIAPFSIPRAAPFLKSLHFTQHSVRPLSWWTAFGEIVTHLTYLDISFFVKLESDLDLVCTQIPQSLAAAPITYLSLALQGDEDEIGAKASLEARSLVDLQAMGLSYAKILSTLQYIDVSRKTYVSNGMDLVRSWWRVVRELPVSDGAICVSVVAINESEGASLKNMYDLQAYDTDDQ